MVEYLSWTISDHNPVLLGLKWTYARPSIPFWRLRPDSLVDQVFREVIWEKIVQCFNDNSGTASFPLVKWDAFKAVLRGQCIAEATGIRCIALNELMTAEQDLRELVRRWPRHPELQPGLQDSKEEVAKQTERLRCFDFKQYLDRTHAELDKSGSLLAWLANLTSKGSPVVELDDEEGGRKYTKEGITDIFAQYYSIHTRWWADFWRPD